MEEKQRKKYKQRNYFKIKKKSLPEKKKPRTRIELAQASSAEHTPSDISLHKSNFFFQTLFPSPSSPTH